MDIRQRPGSPLKDSKTGLPKRDAGGGIRREVRWQARVRRDGHSVSRSFPRKLEAEAWATRTEAKILSGTYHAPAKSGDLAASTFADAIQKYIKEVIVLRKLAWRTETTRAMRLARSSLGSKRFDRLASPDFAAWRNQRLNLGRSPHDVRLDFALVSHLYNTARREWGLTDLLNPVADVSKPKLPAGRDRRLKPGEEKKLLDAASAYGGEMGLIIRFALATAMRRSEIANMLWKHVNWRQRTCLIPVAKDARQERGREVPLSTAAITVLGKILDKNADQPRVWALTPDSISQAFARVCSRAGIMGLRFHDLRHEATSRLFERAHLNPIEAAVVTGHKSMQMLKRYTHLRASDLAKKLG